MFIVLLLLLLTSCRCSHTRNFLKEKCVVVSGSPIGLFQRGALVTDENTFLRVVVRILSGGHHGGLHFRVRIDDVAVIFKRIARGNIQEKCGKRIRELIVSKCTRTRDMFLFLCQKTQKRSSS